VALALAVGALLGSLVGSALAGVAVEDAAGAVGSLGVGDAGAQAAVSAEAKRQPSQQPRASWEAMVQNDKSALAMGPTQSRERREPCCPKRALL